VCKKEGRRAQISIVGQKLLVKSTPSLIEILTIDLTIEQFLYSTTYKFLGFNDQEAN
jgi:hypothetical protein